MRSGVRLGVDVGKARIGVARSDPHGMLATPIETVKRDASGELDVARIEAIAAEYEAFEVIVGLPLNMRGERTLSTEDAAGFAQVLARRLAARAEVRLVDERLSTVSAQGQLHQVGRRVKNSRAVIDQAAAVVILQHALDVERSQDIPPGSLVMGDSGTESDGDLQ